MKPSEIYKLPALDVRHNQDLFMLIDDWHSHVPEIETHDFNFFGDMPPRLEIKIHVDEYSDGERCCVVGSVYLDSKPVMVFRHAGRGGHDEYDRFITDEPLYQEMVKYMREVCCTKKDVSDVVNAEDDIPALDRFYGQQMSELIVNAQEKSGFKPYKIL